MSHSSPPATQPPWLSRRDRCEIIRDGVMAMAHTLVSLHLTGSKRIASAKERQVVCSAFSGAEIGRISCRIISQA